MIQEVLGIDVGGTNVKISPVNQDGEVLSKEKFPTKPLYEDGKFLYNFTSIIKDQLIKYPLIKKIGIGVPGTITKDRMGIISLPNIQGMDNIQIIPELKSTFPDHDFFLENDAAAATLGEYKFSKEKMPDDVIFITLGTGVGGGAVLDGKIFTGGDGNAMEVGHVVASNGKTIEHNIGKRGIINIAADILKNSKEDSLMRSLKVLDIKDINKCAKKGDKLAREVFVTVGTYLGECIVSCVRVLDIKFILIGGGISKNIKYIEKSMWAEIHKFLPASYTDNMKIKAASMGNDAGIMGAASLCFQ